MNLLHSHHHRRRSSSVLMIVFILFLLHSQWHIFFLSFDDTEINNDEMITDSCSCLSLSVSMFTLLTLLSSVSASDSLLPHAFVSPSSSSSFAIHTEKKKKMWKNTMGNSHCFPMIMIFILLSSLRSLCVSYHDGNFSALKKSMWNALNCDLVFYITKFHNPHCYLQINHLWS